MPDPLTEALAEALGYAVAQGICTPERAAQQFRDAAAAEYLRGRRDEAIAANARLRATLADEAT
jgi:hypothetical protein